MRNDAFYMKLGLSISLLSVGLGAVFGFLQVWERVPGINIIKPETYYLALTGHGVLMALVFTTFFIMPLGIFVINRSLRLNTSPTLNLLGFGFATLGTAMAALTILLGKANVLYTFYPPMKAHPAFYLGATLLIVGTWIYTANILLTVRKWRRTGNEGKKLPLDVFGLVATLLIWILATVGVAAEALFLLIPWSLGISQRIDPLLARDLFWYFGHPLVYFWLLPAYIVWYTFIPRLLNVRIFSDTLARVVFALFILFSTPVGFHHQFMDPGIEAGWKYLHTITTYAVFIPSLMTAFTVTATMEMGARLRGGNGLFSWMLKLPWKNPLFSAIALSMILFAFGGASGAVNAGYNLNYVIHNTAWVPGHFHLTVGSAVTLTFMGVAYILVPRVFGKRPFSEKLALIQIYSWFVGVTVFSSSMMYIGILGSPRRTYDVTYSPDLISQWSPYLLATAIGGTVMLVSILMFLYVILRTLLSKEVVSYEEEWESTDPGNPGLVDNLRLFFAIAILIILVAYVLPTLNIIRMGSPGAPPVLPTM